MIGFESQALCCLGSVGCCSLAGLYAYKNRTKIPHISECGFIGKLYLAVNWHTHTAFDMLVEVHQISNLPFANSKILLNIQSGRFECWTQDSYNCKKGQCSIEERFQIHVRQCDDYLKITVYKKGLIKNDLIGLVYVSVNEKLIGESFPKRQKMRLIRPNNSDTLDTGEEPNNLDEFSFGTSVQTSCIELVLSFHKLATDKVRLGDTSLSPLVQQAILYAQCETTEKKENIIDLNKLNDQQKLVFYSKTLEGPLQKLSSMGIMWHNIYVKAVEKGKDKWFWLQFKNRQACIENRKPMVSIPLLSISVVLPDLNNRQCFYIKYHSKKGVHDIIYKRVDRDRNLWSDGLYEFIHRYRAFMAERIPDQITDSSPKVENNQIHDKKPDDNQSNDSNTQEEETVPDIENNAEDGMPTKTLSPRKTKSVCVFSPQHLTPDSVPKNERQPSVFVTKNLLPPTEEEFMASTMARKDDSFLKDITNNSKDNKSSTPVSFRKKLASFFSSRPRGTEFGESPDSLPKPRSSF